VRHRPGPAPLGRPARLLGLVCVILAAIASPAIARPKIDVIVLTNGDRLTGEIVSLESGKLTLKTDSMGTLSIEWDNIASISSTQRFQFESEDGARFTGTIEEGAAPATLRVVTDNTTAEIELALIVRIGAIEKGFWNRLDGSLSSGFNYTWSSRVGTLNVDAEVHSRTERWERDWSLSTYITEQDAGTSSQNDMTFLSRRVYKSRWFSMIMGAAQRNDEMGIRLRVLAAGGAGRHIVQTNHAQFTVMGGLDVNQEAVTGGQSETSAEVLAGLSWSVFRYDYPETNLKMGFIVFPSLTVSGRVRGQVNVSLNRELFKDFFWGLSAYDTYDSKPSATLEASNDWGFVNTLGWKF